jgi:hypothetical protein
MVEPIEQYQCDECNELHDDHDDAARCCAPNVNTRYVCPHCKRPHARVEAAADCITECEKKEQKLMYMASVEELEQAGQSRLFR